MSTAIQIDNLSKRYRLGVIGHGMLYKDLQAWWSRLRGRPDPHGGMDESRNDQVWALENVSLQVEQGQRIGIIGANGAGKSTLLKIISRITLPTRGAVKIRGNVASILGLGIGFHWDLTGRENIYLSGAILGMDRAQIERDFDAIVDFSGVEKFIDTPVKRYSSGMYIRLAFSVAAHLRSEIMAVDDVLSVADVVFQEKCMAKLAENSQKGRTVLFVSHNLANVAKLCNTGILLAEGRIAFQGAIDEAVKRMERPKIDGRQSCRKKIR